MVTEGSGFERFRLFVSLCSDLSI